MDLPRHPQVRYLVSWQMPGEASVPGNLAARDDVKVIRHDTRGLAKNRNMALAAATGDICLLADDDLRYDYPGAFDRIIECFDADPDLGVATFRADYSDCATPYPSQETLLRLPMPVRGYYTSEVEIAFRRSMVQGKAETDEAFGLGCDYIGAGEGDILMVRMLRHLGLKAKFFPITIVSHPGATTGVKAAQPARVIRSRGVFRALYYPYSWPLRLVVDALRDHKTGRAPFMRSLKALVQGALYRLRYIRPDGTRRG